MRMRFIGASLAMMVLLAIAGPARAADPPATELDQVLAADNAGRKVQVAPVIDDWEFLRRVYVDLIGRIPSEAEIQQYFQWSPSQRREKLVDTLLADPRFNDRWTVFFADMLRIRANTQGGPQFLAFVHRSLKDGVPYDELCRALISANGKATHVPEVGYLLGDNVDPMALAGATSQVFMGIRIACAQCHDHPFDVWTREQFYGFAAYFGKTQRIVTPVTETIYTSEGDQQTILWPPEDEAQGAPRKPVDPTFPFELTRDAHTEKLVKHLAELRQEQRAAAQRAAAAAAARSSKLVDDLLAAAGEKAQKQTDGVQPELIDVKAEVQRANSQLRIYEDLYRPSDLRRELADLITSPRNRYFAKALVNRLWRELLGRGIVEPVDDFSQNNPPSHPQTLEYLADQLVLGGYDFRNIVRVVVLSQAYQRDHLPELAADERAEAEAAFAAAHVRRMLSEALYDSIVQAGHLFSPKYSAGYNQRVIRELVRVPVEEKGQKPSPLAQVAAASAAGNQAMRGMAGPMAMAGGSGYDLEKAIEVDFDAVLMAKDDAPAVEEMRAMSAEELQALQMQREMEAQRQRPNVRYVEKMVERVVDFNPSFASAMRMASPVDPNHFLRVFGQPARDALGDHRSHDASMRQALMMLNGQLTHEASRVGNLEPMYALLEGEKADLRKAIRLAYREILTREPSAEEVELAEGLVREADSLLEGMADLRWVLLNGHEFRFLP